MEEEKNLKGTKDVLKYFRLNNTGSHEERSRLIDVSSDTPGSKLYYYPEQDRIVFNEEEVKKFSLDKYGESIPFIDGELTLLNNYFFDFWGYYLTAEATALYAHLKRYAYGSKDFAFPNIPLIAAKMDKHRSTILRYLDILEHYGFAYQFGVTNVSRNNVEESPLFKVRKQIPLLPQRLVYGDPNLEIPEGVPPHIKKALEREKKGLPKLLQKEHEKFENKHLHGESLAEDYTDFEKVYAAWTQYGEILKKQRQASNKVVHQHEELAPMNDHEQVLLKYILEQAVKKISKPSYETWFSHIYLKVENNNYTIIAPNEFATDWLKERYSTLIKEWILELEMEVKEISFKSR